ncbi:hypothetical protein A2U01_0051840, partial [Trifolium medium]|nr:hypothetical protein [Trifolium medium]
MTGGGGGAVAMEDRNLNLFFSSR